MTERRDKLEKVGMRKTNSRVKPKKLESEERNTGRQMRLSKKTSYCVMFRSLKT